MEDCRALQFVKVHLMVAELPVVGKNKDALRQQHVTGGVSLKRRESRPAVALEQQSIGGVLEPCQRGM
ncbi:hypothetical protein INR49_029229 [Caranx melampygus]|nr:hypothetical protein INR49_029229 [Caranx melampygus]